MNITFEQLLNELEKPENENQIKYLANLKNLEHVENVKQLRGLGGVVARVVLLFTKKHMDAFMVLAECKNSVDIVEFKKTKHFEKIKNVETGYDIELLEHLKELEELKDLGKHFQ